MGIIKRYATEDYVEQEIDKINKDLSNYYTKIEANDLHDDLNDYVDAEVAALVNSAPETLDTIGELATAFEENQEVVKVLNDAIVGKVNKTELFNLIYPVGAIYLSVANVNPSTLFCGTWEQIEDRFLLSAGSTYAAGSTGGAATHTLTAAQMPSVTGKINLHGHYIGTPVSGVDGAFSPRITLTDMYGSVTKTIGANSIESIAFDNGGQGKAHNNMPPYLTVYMWKRIK